MAPRLLTALTFVAMAAAGCTPKPPQSCGPGSCSGCCAPDGTCARGDSVEACGVGGSSCAACSSGAQCAFGACLGSGGGAGGGGGGAGGGGGGPVDAGMVTCSAPLTSCAGACVDTARSRDHCGACGVPCGSGRLCVNGACVSLPSTCNASTPCPAGSYCASNGACLLGCDRAEQCPQPGACDLSAHLCVCATGRHACGQSCAANDDVAACGSACEACPTPAGATVTCNGQCQATCPAGQHACGAACVSNSSVATCGQSCSPCSPPANATATCDGTSCGSSCSAGFHLCGGQCVSNQAIATCGASCTACPADANGTATCSGFACGFSCSAGFRDCAAGCRACPSTGVTTTTCSGASCVAGSCDTGYRLCGGQCGACPSQNVATTTCSGTACVAATCLPGYKVCATGCCTKWSFVPMPGAANQPTPGLRFTPSGDAWVMYLDTTKHVVLKRWTGGSTFVTQAVPTTGVQYAGLGLSPAGEPVLALSTVTPAFTHTVVVVAELNGSTWTSTQLFDGAATLTFVYDPVVGFAPTGELYVVGTCQTATSWFFRVWRRSGTTWTSEDVPMGQGLVQGATFHSGVLHLVHTGSLTSSTDQLAWRSTTGWQAMNLAGRYGSALASHGSVLEILSTTNSQANGVMWSLVWNGSTYLQSLVEQLSSPNATQFSGARPGIAIRGGVSHLAYSRSQSFDDLRHAWRTGSTGPYTIETVDTLRADIARIDVGPAGDAAILYSGFVGGVSTVKFAYER